VRRWLRSGGCRETYIDINNDCIIHHGKGQAAELHSQGNSGTAKSIEIRVGQSYWGDDTPKPIS